MTTNTVTVNKIDNDVKNEIKGLMTIASEKFNLQFHNLNEVINYCKNNMTNDCIELLSKIDNCGKVNKNVSSWSIDEVHNYNPKK